MENAIIVLTFLGVLAHFFIWLAWTRDIENKLDKHWTSILHVLDRNIDTAYIERKKEK